MKTTKRITFANVAATTAVVLAVAGTGGAAYALGANTVGSPQIKNESILGKDIKNGQVSTMDVKDGTIAGVDIKPGTRAGFGPGDAFLDQKLTHNITSANAASETVLSLDLPAGEYVVQASFGLRNTSADTRDFTCRIQNAVGEFTGVIAASKARINATDLHSVALTGAVDVDSAANSPVTLTCVGNPADWSGQLTEPRLVAVEVGTLTEQ
jgi:hypothetical protein